MSRQTKWKQYTETVGVSLQVLGSGVESEEFSERFGLRPTSVTKGSWSYETRASLSSRDVNDHLRLLLQVALPHKDFLHELGDNTTSAVCIQWNERPRVPGGGPAIESDCVVGLGQLGVRLIIECC